MATIYREFPIRSVAAWQAVVAFVKANARACIDAEKPLRIIVSQDDRKRTTEQNRYFHGPVLDAITEQAYWNGRQFPKEFWKEYFRRRYLLKGEYVTPDGEMVQVYYSTSELNVGQMTEFMEKVFAEATTTWGVMFE